MNYFSKILIILLLVILPAVGFSQRKELPFENERPSVELTINGENFVVQNLPQEGIVEVFNILGSKVMSFNLRGGTNTTRINLPEGYYILKADNVTKKIVVK